MNNLNNKNRTVPANLANLFASSVLVYMDPMNQRTQIRADVKGKLGIYCWVNLINGNLYVGRASGSVKQLYGRLQDYYQPRYLDHPRNASSLICSALNKYGMESFALLILEFVETAEEAITREQHYFDTMDTPYNVQKSAGHSLGVGVGTTLTDTQKEKAWENQWGGANYIIDGPYECEFTDRLLEQQQMDPPRKYETEIFIQDAVWPEVYATYYSWRTAAALFGITHQALLMYVKRKTRRPYLGRYFIEVTKHSKNHQS